MVRITSEYAERLIKSSNGSIFSVNFIKANGDTIADVCLDPCDPINVGGVDKSGKYHQFDTTEAYHVYEWAKQYGFSVEMKEIDILDIALGNG